jgi:hypothetical protein
LLGGELLGCELLGCELLGGELLGRELLGGELLGGELAGDGLELGLFSLLPVGLGLAGPFPVVLWMAAPAGCPSARAIAADDTTPAAPMRVVSLLTRRRPSSRAATAKRMSSRRMSPSFRRVSLHWHPPLAPALAPALARFAPGTRTLTRKSD